MLYKATVEAANSFFATVVRNNGLLTTVRTVVKLLLGLVGALLEPVVTECVAGTVLEDVSYA